MQSVDNVRAEIDELRERLERSDRRAAQAEKHARRAVGLSAVVGLAALLMATAGPGQSQPTAQSFVSSTVRAPFRVVNGKGRVLFEVSASPGGGAMVINDQRGTPYVRAESILDLPPPNVGALRHLQVFDEGGIANVGLTGITVNGELQQELTVTNEDGNRVLEMGANNGGDTGLSLTSPGHVSPGALPGLVNLGINRFGNRGLELKDDVDVSRITLGFDPAAAGVGLAVNRANGQSSAILADIPGGGVLTLFDDNGNISFFAPP